MPSASSLSGKWGETSHLYSSTDEKIEDVKLTAWWRALFLFTTRGHLPVFALGLTTSIAVGFIGPATSRITGEIFNGFAAYSSGAVAGVDFLEQEKVHIYWLLGVAGFSWIIESVDFILWLSFGELQSNSARDTLFHALVEKDMAWYDVQEIGMAAVVPRLQTQIRELQIATAQPLSLLVTAMATAVLSLIQALLYSWKLTLVTMAGVPLITVLVIWAGSSSQAHLAQHNEKLAQGQKTLTNACTAIDVVKCYNAQSYEVHRYSNTIAQAAYWYRRVVHANAVEMALIALMMVLLFVHGFYYGSVLISRGSLTAGEVVTTFMSAANAFTSIFIILPQMIVLEKGGAAGRALHTIMQVTGKDSTEYWIDAHHRSATCYGEIEFKNVSFNYPSQPHQPVIRNLSMHVPEGEMVFIIGESGSGKSTIGQLLLKLYGSTQGDILLDGRNIESLDKSWLRTNVTLVEQKSALFNDTLFNNIAQGHPYHNDSTIENVTVAAEFALLLQDISDMPQGFHTQIGSRNDFLSGGQRQRVALARARLRDTPVLILDEPTAALDAVSRKVVLDAIRRWRYGKTTLIITHDISEIQPSDYVAVLDGGTVVQEGIREHIEKLRENPFQIRPHDSSSTIIESHNPSRHLSDDLTISSRRVSKISTHSDNSVVLPIRPSLTREWGKRGPTVPDEFHTTSQLSLSARIPLQTLSKYEVLLPASPLIAASPIRPPNLASPLSTRHRLSSLGEAPTASHWPHRCSYRAKEQAVETTELVTAPSRQQLLPTQKFPDSSFDIAPPPKRENVNGKANSVVIVQSAEEIPENFQISLTQIMKTLWPSLNNIQRLALLAGIWAATIHAITSPLTGYMLGKLIGTYIAPESQAHMALVYSMAMLALAITNAIATYLYRVLFEYAAQSWVNKLRIQAFASILDQPRDFFDRNENSSTQLTDSLDRNAEEMRDLLGRFCGMAYIGIVLAAVSFSWALIVQWKLTLITMASGPYVVLVTKIFAAVSNKWEVISNIAAEETGAVFTETFTNIKTVRALTLERHFLDKYKNSANRTLEVGLKRSLRVGLLFGISSSATNLAIALMFLAGVLLVKDGDADVEQVILVYTLLIFAVANLGIIADYIPQISSSKEAAARLIRLARLPRNSHEHLGLLNIKRIDAITFDNVDFSYPSRPGQMVLSHLTLRISHGTCIAIVGSSGSGKSTIASLLLKLYSTSSECCRIMKSNGLTISGHSIDRISTPTLRNLIALVPQDPTIFSMSIYENIAYGLPWTSPFKTMSSIIAAAQQASLHDFIASLPQGYHTLLGDGGLRLSGGQAQRLAIARALLRRPSVLILDEPTAALDIANARAVRRIIREMVRGHRSAGMTVIIITHAREMMEFADRVVVLDKGRIVEDGTFDHLEHRNGPLTKLLGGSMSS